MMTTKRDWYAKLTARETRGLSPAVYAHDTIPSVPLCRLHRAAVAGDWDAVLDRLSWLTRRYGAARVAVAWKQVQP